MKKTLSLLLAFCMLGAAGAGCSSSEAPSSSGEAPVSDTDASSGTGSSEGEASFEGVTLRFAPIWNMSCRTAPGRCVSIRSLSPPLSCISLNARERKRKKPRPEHRRISVC